MGCDERLMTFDATLTSLADAAASPLLTRC